MRKFHAYKFPSNHQNLNFHAVDFAAGAPVIHSADHGYLYLRVKRLDETIYFRLSTNTRDQLIANFPFGGDEDFTMVHLNTHQHTHNKAIKPFRFQTKIDPMQLIGWYRKIKAKMAKAHLSSAQLRAANNLLQQLQHVNRLEAKAAVMKIMDGLKDYPTFLQTLSAGLTKFPMGASTWQAIDWALTPLIIEATKNTPVVVQPLAQAGIKAVPNGVGAGAAVMAAAMLDNFVQTGRWVPDGRESLKDIGKLGIIVAIIDTLWGPLGAISDLAAGSLLNKVFGDGLGDGAKTAIKFMLKNLMYYFFYKLTFAKLSEVFNTSWGKDAEANKSLAEQYGRSQAAFAWLEVLPASIHTSAWSILTTYGLVSVAATSVTISNQLKHYTNAKEQSQQVAKTAIEAHELPEPVEAIFEDNGSSCNNWCSWWQRPGTAAESKPLLVDTDGDDHATTPEATVDLLL